MAGPSAAVMAGRARRAGAAGDKVRWEWKTQEVVGKVRLTLYQRMRVATEYLKSKVVENISRPVTKTKGVRSGRIVVSNRSVAGEFPKSETARLLSDVFGIVRKQGRGIVDGYIGVTLDYGLILETQLNRSFLVRSLNQERGAITRMITKPMKA